MASRDKFSLFFIGVRHQPSEFHHCVTADAGVGRITSEIFAYKWFYDLFPELKLPVDAFMPDTDFFCKGTGFFEKGFISKKIKGHAQYLVTFVF